MNRIADATVAVDDLVADPVEAARAIQPLGAPHDKIAAPRDLYGPIGSIRAASISPTNNASPRSPMDCASA